MDLWLAVIGAFVFGVGIGAWWGEWMHTRYLRLVASGSGCAKLGDGFFYIVPARKMIERP